MHDGDLPTVYVRALRIVWKRTRYQNDSPTPPSERDCDLGRLGALPRCAVEDNVWAVDGTVGKRAHAQGLDRRRDISLRAGIDASVGAQLSLRYVWCEPGHANGNVQRDGSNLDSPPVAETTPSCRSR